MFDLLEYVFGFQVCVLFLFMFLFLRVKFVLLSIHTPYFGLFDVGHLLGQI